jgi:plasmid stabilization system protein ParE
MSDRYRILLAKRVSADLSAIFEHIAKDSRRNAGRMVGRILDAIEGLKIFPHRNVLEGQHPRVKHPVRSLPVGAYMIFFRVEDGPKVLRVLRVRHGAQRRLKRY